MGADARHVCVGEGALGDGIMQRRELCESCFTPSGAVAMEGVMHGTM